VASAVATAHSVTGKPAVAYPNRGEAWHGGATGWVGPGAFDPADAVAWVAAGATYVGGCCRIGAPDIAALADALHG